MSRNSRVKSTGESLQQVEARREATNSGALVAAMEAQRTAYMAQGLSLDEVTILLAAHAKKARKQAQHSQVTKMMPRERFAAKAQPKKVVIDGVPYSAAVKFANPDKSYGWNISQQVTVEIDGELVPCQLGFNLTVIGSKPAK